MKMRIFLTFSMFLMIFNLSSLGCIIMDYADGGSHSIDQTGLESLKDRINAGLPFGDYSFISNMVLVDGGFLVTGADTDIIDGERQTASYAAMLSLSGELQWERLYLSGESSELYDGIEIGEGIYLLTGCVNRQQDDVTFFLCVDGEGDVIWESELPDEGDRIYRLLNSDGEGVYALGYAEEEKGYDGLLVKLDTAGNVDWRRTYDEGASEFFTDGAFSPEGDIVLMGARKWMEVLPGRVPFYSQLYVMSVDADGEAQWRTFYGKKKDYTMALDLVVTREGDYAITGSVSVDRTQEDVLFAILDGNGSIKVLETHTGLYDEDDIGYCILQTPDDRFMVIGTSWTWMADQSFNGWHVANAAYLVLDQHGSNTDLGNLDGHEMPPDPAMPYSAVSDGAGDAYMVAADPWQYTIYKISFVDSGPVVEELVRVTFPDIAENAFAMKK